jgi:hypothetical protein
MSRTWRAGVAAISFALLSLVASFMTTPIFLHRPGWILVACAPPAAVAIWQGIVAAMGERKAHGRGLGITGIVLGVVGVVGIFWSAFLAIVGTIVENDTTLLVTWPA